MNIFVFTTQGMKKARLRFRAMLCALKPFCFPPLLPSPAQSIQSIANQSINQYIDFLPRRFKSYSKWIWLGTDTIPDHIGQVSEA